MKASFLKRSVQWLMVLPALLMCQHLTAAVSFTSTPLAVSNSYIGSITLQITGLNGGESVIAQRFLDVNANGTIDGADLLWQQFLLTDGQASVIGGATNINVPGDTDATPGRIAARVKFPISDPGLNVVGRYVWRLSSPTGLFAPSTSLFTISNAVHGQGLTGQVRNNGTNVPNALVLVFEPPGPGDDGPGWVVASTVADNAGSYILRLPTGTYMAAGFKSNFLGSFTSPPLTVGSGAMVSANVNISNATQIISGRLVDAENHCLGLPGLLLHVTGVGLAAAGFSDGDGHFTLPVVPGRWRFGANDSEALGYLALDSDNVPIDTTTGSVSGLLIRYPKATALFYGRVTDTQDQPLAGVFIFSESEDDLHQHNAFTDENGNYAAGARGGESWSVQVDNDQPTVTNHLYSEGLYEMFQSDQADLYNFTAIRATNHITGRLQTANGTGIPNVEIYAIASIGEHNYYTEVDTDSNGNYSLLVASGSWDVWVYCGGDGWPPGYCCPGNQVVNIVNADGVANFTPSGQMLITTPASLPTATVGEFYSFSFSAQACAGGALWSADDLPPGLSLSWEGELAGHPEVCGSNFFTVQVSEDFGGYATKAFSLVIQPPSSGSISDYLIGKTLGHRQTNPATVVPDGSQGPYNAYLWILQDTYGAVSDATCTLPNNVQKVFPSGCSGQLLEIHDIFASAAASDIAYPMGNYRFDINTAGDGAQFSILNMPAVEYPDAPRVSNYSAAQAIHPADDFYLEWDAMTAGTAEDLIRLYILGLNDGPDFKLIYPEAVFEDVVPGDATSSLIAAGRLETNRTYLGVLQFIRVTSLNEMGHPTATGWTFVSTQTVFPLATTGFGPVLSEPERVSPTQFRFMLTGRPGECYRILKSTDLSSANWSILMVTNAPAESFMVLDPSATNRNAFYRAVAGP